MPGPDGDVDAALTAIESYCTDTETPLVISVVPEEKAPELLLRWPRLRMNNERNWKDYLYRAEDMAAFAGRKYSGQRNHINKFRKEYSDAKFVPLTGRTCPSSRISGRIMSRSSRKPASTPSGSWPMPRLWPGCCRRGWLLGGGLLVDDRLVAMSLAGELRRHPDYSCGEGVVLPPGGLSHPGPGLFAAHFGGDCVYINREDDAGDRGLRTSKLQYLPVRLAGSCGSRSSARRTACGRSPPSPLPRLTLTPLEERDEAAYNALCLDDARNRWWGL